MNQLIGAEIQATNQYMNMKDDELLQIRVRTKEGKEYWLIAEMSEHRGNKIPVIKITER